MTGDSFAHTSRQKALDSGGACMWKLRPRGGTKRRVALGAALPKLSDPPVRGARMDAARRVSEALHGGASSNVSILYAAHKLDINSVGKFCAADVFRAGRGARFLEKCAPAVLYLSCGDKLR